MNKREVFHAFTDGSCSPNPGAGGWAWVYIVPHKNIEIRFIDSGGKQKSTNNEMELTAMLECLRNLTKKTKPYKVIIHSDSDYVLKGLIDGGNGIVGRKPRGWCYKWKLNGWRTTKGECANKLLWQKLCLECERCYKDKIELEMVWVKGHSDDEGNDLVDTLAKRARPK
jgi:ribonuclease HI